MFLEKTKDETDLQNGEQTELTSILHYTYYIFVLEWVVASKTVEII